MNLMHVVQIKLPNRALRADTEGEGTVAAPGVTSHGGGACSLGGQLGPPYSFPKDPNQHKQGPSSY